ncbi:hypothetical protein OJ253_244 [Cryptosporidium canis]|uniref:DOT1 domain-containing protein n=1 Tax=Cryptosporidium canis TaxID=195482 RepID=A0A9D5HYV5_9CRYT|nr:hypothetical protein OJ253_244 [Cryptosporidium canis]
MTGKGAQLRERENNPTNDVNTGNKKIGVDCKQTPNCCCKMSKCVCTSFLWRGVNADLGTSDQGMYGETREKGLRRIFSKMVKYGMDNHSVLLDIGSGRGVPNIVASFQNNLFSSIGIELDENAFYLSQSNHLHILESIGKNSYCEDSNIQSSEYKKTNRKINLGFLKGDATELQTFEPVTHIYSFDAAMPVWIIKRFVDLFNMSKTTYCYVSYRKDLVETLGLNADRIHGIPTQMAGSGEGRMCWLYLKNDWKEVKSHAKFYIHNKYKNSMNSELFDVKTPNSIDDIIRFSICNTKTQKSLIHDSLNFWFNNRKSRREYLAERKVINQRYKELKQSYLDGKSNKENANQLTLEDVGIKVESIICSKTSKGKNTRKQKVDSVTTRINNNLADKKGSSVNNCRQHPKSLIDTHIHPTIKILDPSNMVQGKCKVKRKVVDSENKLA